MDSFGSIGPEKDDYASDVRQVAESLLSTGTVFVPLTDKMTRINLVVATRASIATPFDRPSGLIPEGLWLFIAVLEHGAFWFDCAAYNDPGYVATKLRLETPDGETVAEFLTRLRAELRPTEVAA